MFWGQRTVPGPYRRYYRGPLVLSGASQTDSGITDEICCDRLGAVTVHGDYSAFFSSADYVNVHASLPRLGVAVFNGEILSPDLQDP